MGYYINIRQSDAYLPAENIDECNRIWQELNNNDDSPKSGGQWSEGKQTKRWFSWMPEDWTGMSTDDILANMGFEVSVGRCGIYIEGYYSKAGDEEFLMEKVGHLFRGDIEWVGEEGEHWKWAFGDTDNEHMCLYHGRVVYE